MNGAEILVMALEQQGVRCVFGLPGTETLPLYEALRRSSLRTVLASSEVGAAFMAGGLARLTHNPGVLATMQGPGFAWALAGLAEARLDSVPLLHICVAPPRTPAGKRFRLQELNQEAIAAPLVKAVIEARRPGEVAARVSEALTLTTAGEPGPVLLQLPSDVFSGQSENGSEPPGSRRDTAPDLEACLARVRSAQRPVLLVGQGVQPYAARLRRAVEAWTVPVLTTSSARGVLPEDHALALGFDPVSGDIEAVNALVASCDLVLVLGAKLGHNGSGGFRLRLPRERLVRVDTSDEVLNANYPTDLPVRADAGIVLDAVSALPPSRSSWTSPEIAAWRARVTRTVPGPEPRIRGSASGDAAGFFTGLRRALPRDAVLVLDSGMHQVMARRHFMVLEADGLLFPSDLQSMGFGIPTAIGACLAGSERRVVALVGDGGFSMTGMELLSAVREGLDLIVIVFADGALGQIRLQQLMEYGVAHGVEPVGPDWRCMAAALGVTHIEANSGIEEAMVMALRQPGVTLVEVSVGDGPTIRRAATVALARSAVRRALGPSRLQWVKRWFGRRA